MNKGSLTSKPLNLISHGKPPLAPRSRGPTASQNHLAGSRLAAGCRPAGFALAPQRARCFGRRSQPGAPPCSAYSSHRRFTILSSENWCARADFGVAWSPQKLVSVLLWRSQARALSPTRRLWQLLARWHKHLHRGAQPSSRRCLSTTSLTPKRSPRGSFRRSATLPRIAAPGDVWSHVSLVFVSVTPLSGLLTTELGYTTAWDDEHTLGARFQSGRFIELCGSVLPP